MYMFQYAYLDFLEFPKADFEISRVQNVHFKCK